MGPAHLHRLDPGRRIHPTSMNCRYYIEIYEHHDVSIRFEPPHTMTIQLTPALTKGSIGIQLERRDNGTTASLVRQLWGKRKSLPTEQA